MKATIVKQYAIISNRYYRKTDSGLVETDPTQVHQERIKENNVTPIEIAHIDHVTGKYFLIQHN